ncbi:hypothetical protein ACH492_13090 [Streptomyces sp. NPDC019443]|uniref:hypothetical protein n=1 Tax=Streptomyces sp. NPDC019443 TaxID=3365061 RepID=UPI0037A50A6A
MAKRQQSGEMVGDPHGKPALAHNRTGGAAFCAASRGGRRGGDGAHCSRNAAYGLDGHRQ